MVSPAPALSFRTDFDPEAGKSIAVALHVRRVTAANAGPYTFTGTNSFLLGEETVALVDPGPDDDRHLEALLSAIDGRAVEAIILTHTHKDHSALARRLQQATSAPLWFSGPHRLSRKARFLEINPISNSSDWTLRPDRVLRDGEIFDVAGLKVEAIATPGHCANHMAFGLFGTPFLLSGDHVMGWSSTLVSVPDGSMADYLSSLDRIIAAPYLSYLPAHGGPIDNGPDYARALKAHREMRNSQIIAAVTDGATGAGQLLKGIYPTLALPLHRAARMTLTAHVEYLADRGHISAHHTLLGWRLAP
jgi:glyoxylase-like metal-dependent hydrolase (beta-lactamase superfamily II)